MDLIHKLLNILLLPINTILLLSVLPLYIVLIFLSYGRKLLHSENVAGKVVLVTGAASGIGEQIAYEYAKRGACLALVDIREDRLGSVVDRARFLGSPDVIHIGADVSKVEDCERFVGAAVNHFGRLDHLVNNAGIGGGGCLFKDVQDISPLRQIMETNFWGAVYSTHFALSHLRKSRGKIIVMSSSLGRLAMPKLTAYCASKAALINFFDTLRLEIGGDIGITIVTPGHIETEMTERGKQKAGMNYVIPEESKEACARAIFRSACRGDKYLTEPSWVASFFYWRAVYPEIMEYFSRLVFAISRRSSKNKASGSNQTSNHDTKQS